jgi:nicotinamidase-related amidase
METLDPRRTALVLIDLQKGILPFAGGPHSADDVLKKARSLIDRFHELGAPVALVRVGWSADGGDAPRQVVDGGIFPTSWA